MKINLRKANAIQAEIRKAIASIVVEFNVSINEYTTDSDELISKAQVALGEALDRKAALTTVLYMIRSKVSQSNADYGVNTLLTKVEECDAMMSITSLITTSTVAMGSDEIKARLRKMQEAPANTSMRDSMYGEKTITTSIMTKEGIDIAKDHVSVAKRTKQGYLDELLTLNVNTLIELNDNTVKVLKSEGII